MKNKGEKGSITLFVFIVCMFIVIMLASFIMSIENKKQAQNKQIDQITQSYQSNEEEMEKAYSKALNID